MECAISRYAGEVGQVRQVLREQDLCGFVKCIRDFALLRARYTRAVSLADELTKQQREDDQRHAVQRAKFGEYTTDACPNCTRHRIMRGADEKRRCQKCAWCIEDGAFDFGFLDFIR